MRAKWQKAKILSSGGPNPHLVGKETWVLCMRPITVEALIPKDLTFHHFESVYYVNFFDENGDEMVCPTHHIELMARGPEDFAESVEMVPYEVWSNPSWEGC